MDYKKTKRRRNDEFRLFFLFCKRKEAIIIWIYCEKWNEGILCIKSHQMVG